MSTPLERALTFARAIVAATTPDYTSPAHIVATALIEAEALIASQAAMLAEIHDLVFNSQEETHAELLKEMAAWERHSDANLRNLGRLASQDALIQSMREAIEALPHESMCEAWGTREDWCNCWKAALAQVSASPLPPRPKVICLCGSTRFIEQFAISTWEMERQGFIVLGCTLLPTWYCKVQSHFGEATGTKQQCDDLHKRKIDLADEVLVLNIGGYIGESTQNEIEYAAATGKPVKYFEPMSASPKEEQPK